jgi:hypothetical protein
MPSPTMVEPLVPLPSELASRVLNSLPNRECQSPARGSRVWCIGWLDCPSHLSQRSACTTIQQQLDDFGISLSRCNAQCRQTRFSCHVHVSAAIEKQLNQPFGPSQASEVQRGPPILSNCVDCGASVQKQLYQIDVAVRGGKV